MSAEFRHIFFSDSEILRMVMDYHREYQRNLPHGSVVGLTVSADPSPKVEGSIAPDKGGAPVPFVLTGPDLDSAIISHCIRDKIPLPQRGAAKSVQVFGERLALVVSMNVSSVRLNGF